MSTNNNDSLGEYLVAELRTEIASLIFSTELNSIVESLEIETPVADEFDFSVTVLNEIARQCKPGMLSLISARTIPGGWETTYIDCEGVTYTFWEADQISKV